MFVLINRRLNNLFLFILNYNNLRGSEVLVVVDPLVWPPHSQLSQIWPQFSFKVLSERNVVRKVFRKISLGGTISGGWGKFYWLPGLVKIVILGILDTLYYISTTSLSQSFHKIVAALNVVASCCCCCCLFLPHQTSLVVVVVESGQGRNVSCGAVSVLPHQRDQTGGVARLPEERMVEKLNCTGSLGGIPH